MQRSVILHPAVDEGVTTRWALLASGFAALLLLGCVLPVERQFAVLAAAVTLLGGVLALQVGLRSPVLGLSLLLVVAVVLPLEVSIGPSRINASLPGAALLCGLWVLRQVLAQRQVAVDRSMLALAALVFMAIATLSFVVGQFPWFRLAGAPMRAQAGGLLLFVLSGGVLLMVGHQATSLAHLRRLTWLFVGLGGAAVVLMLLPGTDVTVGPLAITATRSVGCLFFTWLVAVSVSQALFNRDLSVLQRWMALAVAALTLFRGLFVTFSWVSGWLPPLVALWTIALLRFPRTVMGLSLLAAAPAVALGDRAWASIMAGESYSWMTRMEALSIMGHVIERNPLLGLGPANYRFYTPLFPLLGFPARFNSHNNYVDLVAQTGVLGLGVFCWIALETLRLALRLWRRLPAGFGRAYASGVIGGLAGTLFAGLLADWIIPFVYNIGWVGFRSSVLFWFFLGGLLALDRITRERPRPHPAHGHLQGRPAASRA